jgi:hypothetical protein
LTPYAARTLWKHLKPSETSKNYAASEPHKDMRFILMSHTPYFVSHAQETYTEMSITETHTAEIEVNGRRMKPEPFGDI